MTEQTKEKTEKYAVNLPKTDFPMKANSAVREIEIQNEWDAKKVYELNLKARYDCPKFVLHDGPPYLSSSKIHIGTALNKILKDIVTKYKAQRGFYAPYVPGYDSHGLPIENAVLKDIKGGRHSMSPVELRQKCRDFALSNLKGQEDNFKRLGVWGEWSNPYITLNKEFEAAQIRVFGKMAAAGYLYKGLKPVSWCPNCETALAEAEVEYADHSSEAIYVKFILKADEYSKLPKDIQKLELKSNIYFVIWTTTPWTLPANLGIALHPEFSYNFVETKEHGVLIVSESLRLQVLQAASIEEQDTKIIATALGKDLENLLCEHPFMPRTSKVILGEHVTSDTGTGCVHTAPGHGPDDFIVGKRYKLGVVSPVDGRGIFTDEAGKYANTRYDKSNQAIIGDLNDKGVLLNHQKIVHSYPHCWRCKKPLIFRATEQWFASVDGFREKALKAIDEVQWLPASGRNRIFSMVEKRSDWCISRQRAWGVPIPIFYSKKTGKPLLDEKVIAKVADIFEKKGSDSWWIHNPEYFLGDNFSDSDNSTEFVKETDIMDVWFDSGVSHAAVLDTRKELRGSPCELYLEGSDQHRGWFQSALLTSVAIHNRAPYKTVLTHGFVVDENGRKMSKSIGNVVLPEDVIKQYGADVLRLWVASVNYTDDIPIGKSMLAQLAEVYRKLRNTARYLLGNLHGFAVSDKVAYEKMSSLDQFILHRLQEVISQIRDDFDKYEFFKYYQVLQNFCVVDLSSFYFDIVKDRLYTSAYKSENRRAVQTVLYELLQAITRVLVPVTPHLAEDIWQHIPASLKTSTESVLLTDFPEIKPEYLKQELNESWLSFISMRSIVNKALEQARASRKVGSSLEAKVILQIEDDLLRQKCLSKKDSLASLFITSQAIILEPHQTGIDENDCFSVVEENGIKVFVIAAEGEKCARCWKFTNELKQSQKYLDLCKACAEAVELDLMHNKG